MSKKIKIPGFWRLALFLILAAGLAVTFRRWTEGLGSVSNLSDQYPWGIWVGFDILCGIGLAAGGFLITAVVYIFRLERFKPIVRPALLTAFIGYMLEVLALMVDLGRPWNLWRPLLTWNPDSVMFVVSWCVTVYLIVMMMEVSGMVFERLGWERAARRQRRLMMPLVVLGVVLSIIHQSSLGALYLIVGHKMHPLWAGPWLPAIFVVSAVMVGLAMIIVESRLSGRAFKHHLEGPVLFALGRALFVLLGAYIVLRGVDLFQRGVAADVLVLTKETSLFWVEIFLGAILPMLILAGRQRRENLRWLHGTAVLTVLGFVLHRLNLSMTSFESSVGYEYVPTMGEFAVTLMLIGIGVVGFRLAVRHLRVFPDTADHAVN